MKAIVIYLEGFHEIMVDFLLFFVPFYALKSKNVYYFYNQKIQQSLHHFGQGKLKEKLQD